MIRWRPLWTLPFRLLGLLGSLALAALLVAGERRWNRPGVAALLVLVLTGCSALQRWLPFELPGEVAYGTEADAECVAYVIVGRRLVPVPVDDALYVSLRRGQRVIVSGEASSAGELRRLVLKMPAGTDA